MADWESKWLEATKDIRGDFTWQQGADKLRQLIQTGLLTFTDMKDDPAKFFKAHRLLVDPLTGAGFWIRFTVQYNLFAGTVLGLGGPEQIQALADYQKQGLLGCFGLTERLAGVNSGLVVQTTVEWLPEKQRFLLHSPSEGAVKNWISQGLSADKCAVIANLQVDGKALGPHGFIMDFRRNGKLVEGVEIGDMGIKTTANDLDNAWIRFNNVLLPKEALLNRYCKIENDKYVQTTNERMRIEVIGQRLLTGRVAVAQTSLTFARKLYAHTQKYSDTKKCWSPSGNQFLSQIPQLASLYAEAQNRLSELERFTHGIENEISGVLRNDGIPSSNLVHDIAVAKIASVETSIELCHRLKQEVGSYALMARTGFENLDFMQCAKFAEGDSRILMQKLARDTVKAFVVSGGKTSGSPEETRLCKLLASAGKSGWDANFDNVYLLANLVISRSIQARLAKAKL
jgi:acyl-CoA oxidase